VIALRSIPLERGQAADELEPPPFLDELDGAADEARGQMEIASRVPPHDLDAEAAVLSAVMVDPLAFGKVNELLRPEHFYSEAHRRIYEAAVELSVSGRPVDVVQVASWLRDRDRLAQVGGMAYLTQVLNAAPAVANVAAYGKTIHEKWRIRQLILTCQRAEAKGYAGYGDAEAFIANVLEEIEGLRKREALALLDGSVLAEPLPEVEHVVAEIGLVAGGGAPHLIAGYGFSGKSLACQALLVALAAGAKVWGAYDAPARRVVHVDLEQGERLTRRRYQRLAKAMGVDLAALGDALAVAIMPPGLTLSAACEPRWRALMTGRDLVLVDSLRAATAGADENDSSIRAGLDMLGALSEATGCRALVIHHARKPNGDAPGGRYSIRGSSAIYDGSDSVYVFSAERGEPIRVEHAKARSHGEPVEDFALVVTDAEIDGDPRAGVRVDLRGAELVAQRREQQATEVRHERVRADAEVVRRVLTEQPGLGSRELRGAVRVKGGVGAERLADALAHLGDAVEIRDEVRGRSRTARHYLRGAA